MSASWQIEERSRRMQRMQIRECTQENADTLVSEDGIDVAGRLPEMLRRWDRIAESPSRSVFGSRVNLPIH